MGYDTLVGGDGNDKLFGDSGADWLDGGAGRDTVGYWTAVGAVQVYLWGTAYNKGEAAGDTYVGIEVIDGSRFNDTLEGNGAANAFWGDAGNDHMKGGAGADTLSGGDGDDKLDGGAGADHFNGGNGRDTVSYWSASGAVQVYLGDPSRSTGEAFGDTSIGIEVIDGSVHSDVLEGNGEANTFWADAGHDLLRGWGGSDVLKGASGDDWLVGGTGGDLLDGGDGYDTADYSNAAARVIVDRTNMSRNAGEAAGDSYVSIEGVVGSAHNDEFYGGAGWDGFWAGAGDDILEGRGGGDHLNGGDGFDFAVYWNSGGVKASLLYSYLNTGDAAGDKYESIEGLQGSWWNDMLQGDHRANTLWDYGGDDLLLGEGGNDYIYGGDGADTLSGGDGLDWLVGAAGRDTYRFDTWLSAANVDTVQGFNAGEDQIQLSRSIFGGVTGGTYLDMSAFTTGSAATTAAHRIIYNKTTGDLFYDADGSGWSAGQVKFASIGAGHNLMNSHFLLFW